MPVGFADFRLDTSRSTTNPMPAEAVRERIVQAVERRTKDGTRQLRADLELLYHVDCNAASIHNADTVAFLNQQTVVDPFQRAFKRLPSGVIATAFFFYSGTWTVRNVNIQDNEDKTARVSWTLAQELYDWKTDTT